MSKYTGKSMDELDRAKQDLDVEREELRATLRAMTEEQRGSKSAKDLREQMVAIRQEKLAIQAEQDRLLSAIPRDPNAYVIGDAGNVQSEESVGNIGGSKPKTTSKKK